MDTKIPPMSSSELKKRPLWEGMGFASKDDPTFHAMQVYVASLCVVYLDLALPHSQQATDKLRVVTEKAISTFRAFQDNYEDCWPIKELVRNTLYNRKRNEGQKQKKAARKAAQDNIQLEGQHYDVGPDSHPTGVPVEAQPAGYDDHSLSPVHATPGQGTWIPSNEDNTRLLDVSIGVVADLSRQFGSQDLLVEYGRKILEKIFGPGSPRLDAQSGFYVARILIESPASFSNGVWFGIVSSILGHAYASAPRSLNPWEIFFVWVTYSRSPIDTHHFFHPLVSSLLTTIQCLPFESIVPISMLQFWTQSDLLSCLCVDCVNDQPCAVMITLRTLRVVVASPNPSHLPEDDKAVFTKDVLDILSFWIMCSKGSIRMLVADCLMELSWKNPTILTPEGVQQCAILLNTLGDQDPIQCHKHIILQKAGNLPLFNAEGPMEVLS